MQSASALFGDALLKQINTTLHEYKVHKAITSFGANSKFLDETDLDDKYSKKADQLQNIKDFAPRFYCPVRKVTLFADPEYTLSQLDEQEQGRKTSRSCEEPDKLRPAKKNQSQG